MMKLNLFRIKMVAKKRNDRIETLRALLNK